MTTSTESLLGSLADLVALVYHEARNVRHLVHAGHLPAAPWAKLVGLPTNRDHAWIELQRTRREARSGRKSVEVLLPFGTRFGVDLVALLEMYQNPNWKHAKAYGGNAWADVTKHVIDFVDAIEQADLVRAEVVLAALERASHNTGSVLAKLHDLDSKLPRNRKVAAPNNSLEPTRTARENADSNAH